jgi:hypothetical protein
MSKVKIVDNLKNYINDNFPELQNYNIIINLLPLVLIVYLYYTSDITLYTKFFKLTAIILFIRLILNNITEISDITINEKYSQINVSLVIFIICILLLLGKDELNNYSSLAIISIYIILQSLNTFTTDNILTSILVLFIYQFFNF